jgi:hypothetical protein
VQPRVSAAGMGDAGRRAPSIQRHPRHRPMHSLEGIVPEAPCTSRCGFGRPMAETVVTLLRLNGTRASAYGGLLVRWARPDGLGVEVNPANAQPAAGFWPIDPQALGVSAFALSLEVLVCVRASRGRAAGVRRMGAVSSPRRTRAHAGLPSIVRAR